MIVSSQHFEHKGNHTKEEKKSKQAHKKRKKHKKVKNIPKNPCFKSLVWDYSTAHCTKKIDTQKKFLGQYLPPEIAYHIIQLYTPLSSSVTKINKKNIVYKRNAPAVIPQEVQLVESYEQETFYESNKKLKASSKKLKEIMLGLYIDKGSAGGKRYIQLNTKNTKQIIQQRKLYEVGLEESEYLSGMPYARTIVGTTKDKSICMIGYIFDKPMFLPISSLNFAYFSSKEKVSTCSLFANDIVPLGSNRLIISTNKSIFIANLNCVIEALYRFQYTNNKHYLANIWCINNWKISLPRHLTEINDRFKKLFAITNRTLIGLTHNGTIYTIAMDRLLNACSSEDREKYFAKQTLKDVSQIRDLSKDPDDPTRLVALSKTKDIYFLSLHNQLLVKLCRVPCAKEVWIHKNLIMIKCFKPLLNRLQILRKQSQKNYELCFVDGDDLLSKRIKNDKKF